MEEELDSPQEESVELTPGLLLSRARLAKRLTQEAVAEKLKLSTQWVKDIENNDYSYAGALIYAQGYLRSYARLVGVSEESVLDAFESSGLSSQFDRNRQDGKLRVRQSVVVSSAFAGRSWMQRKARWLRWVSVAMGVGLVLMVVAWWQGQGKRVHSATRSQPALSVQPQSLPLNNTADDQ